MRRLVPELDASGQDSYVRPGDDLTKKVKRTLGDFLRDAVDDPETGKRNSDNRTFIDAATVSSLDASTFFSRLPVDDLNSLNAMLDENITSQIGQTDILSSINGSMGGLTTSDDVALQQQTEAKIVVGAVSKVLGNNRFTAANTFTDAVNSGQIATMPTSIGNFDLTGAPVTFEQLQKVGMSLMLRATGEFIEGDPTSPGVSLASLIPGQAQLGSTIDATSLYADSVTGAPGRDPAAGRPRTRLRDVLFGDAQRSYGQLNSANEPFGGFMPLGMTALAVVLVVTLRLVSTGLVTLISTIAGKPFSTSTGKLGTDPLAMGVHGGQTAKRKFTPITLADIGIVELDRDLGSAINEGLRVFFAFKGEDFGRVARSPGFYANMVRTIVQSSGRIIRDVTDAFKTFSSGDVVGGAQSVMGIVDVLKTSKVIAFLNIMAVLGDRSFALQEAGVITGIRSTHDTLPDNEATRVMRSRVIGSDGAATLAWRGSAPVSALIMPKQFAQAASRLQTDYARYVAARVELSHGIAVSGDPPGGRLTHEEVEEVERHLDAEYVPFYFHDLRTNEFVSFHAFISSINESFTPSYGETQAYGRIDPVMTYGSTRRDFTFSFHVVATSPTDFDMMYVKLNKLVTLVYPQFTAGRRVVDADGGTFTQPFSQVPGASPLIRLRLGNVVRSNFSNVALARLFGLGADDFLDGNPASSNAAAIERGLTALRKQIASSGWQAGQLATLLPLGIKFTNSLGGVTPPTVAGIADTNKLRNFNRIRERSSLVTIKGPATTRVEFAGVEQRVYQVTFKEPGLEGITVTVPESALAITVDEVTRTLGTVQPATSPTSVSDPQREFFNPDGNAIVRSFRNTKGKGLPGFITALGFDWHEADGSWDVERFAARAPQFVKVNVSFTVIHDIPPGLDSDGFNRAPTHTIGDVMHGTWGDAYDDSGAGRARFDKAFAEVKGKQGS